GGAVGALHRVPHAAGLRTAGGLTGTPLHVPVNPPRQVAVRCISAAGSIAPMLVVFVFADAFGSEGNAILDRLEALENGPQSDAGGPGVRRYMRQAENPDDALAWFERK